METYYSQIITFVNRCGEWKVGSVKYEMVQY